MKAPSKNSPRFIFFYLLPILFGPHVLISRQQAGNLAARALEFAGSKVKPGAFVGGTFQINYTIIIFVNKN